MPASSLHARVAVATLLASLALTGLALPACAGARLPAIGIAEQTPVMFADQRFVDLGIRYARISVAWDVLRHPRQRAALNTWLVAARADGVQPLIGFDRSAVAGRARALPSAARFGHEFRRLHALYPWVRDWASWNEANYCGEPTCHRARLVAAYYRQLRASCASCRVLGAELLDVSNMVRWAREFRAALHGREPMIWGLHNYLGANRLQSASTRALLRATRRAPIWFTEVGGLVSRHNHSSNAFPQSAAHAAKVTRFLFTRLARLSGRIARVYVYQWNGGGPRATWDSGLIAPGGRARAAYGVFVRELDAFGQLPATPAAAAALAAAGSG